VTFLLIKLLASKQEEITSLKQM